MIAHLFDDRCAGTVTNFIDTNYSNETNTLLFTGLGFVYFLTCYLFSLFMPLILQLLLLLYGKKKLHNVPSQMEIDLTHHQVFGLAENLFSISFCFLFQKDS